MKGTIKSVTVDTLYVFQGEILGEDGNSYRFNGNSWYNRSLTLADITVGQAVEFEKKPPNAKGIVYPRWIHFPGESIPMSRSVNHSRGEFKALVYIIKEKIYPAMETLVGGFDPAVVRDEGSLYKALAIHYNGLSDADFLEKGASPNAVLLFPTGFKSADGHDILLYCTENTSGKGSAWRCDRVCCDGKVSGSVFDVVNANWYDMRNMIQKLTKTSLKDVEAVVQTVEKRCVDLENAVVCLKDGYETDWNNADTLYVPTGYHEEGGKEIYLLCTQKTGVRGLGWYVRSATYEEAPITLMKKKDWIEHWGGAIPDDMYDKLAKQTLEEKWDFGTRKDFGILRNYLRYTFAHQWKEGKVVVSADGQIAAFNTGLPHRRNFQHIYAFYEMAPMPVGGPCHPLHYVQPFEFKQFVCIGDGGNGKVLADKIDPLPSPPQYFTNRSATVWELEYTDGEQVSMPRYDDKHILIQRCERIPLEFYQQFAFYSKRLKAILDSADPVSEKYKAIREYFRPVLVDDGSDDEATTIYQKLADALNSVISNAMKRLSWNWRAVVPCYSPDKEGLCFLLPVSFCDLEKPDRALIASKNENGKYIIHTVIFLDWAYLDARLVCRPESEWLGTDLTDVGDDDMDEDD